MTCASCGAAVPSAQKFCGECGTPVRADAPRKEDPLRDELALALGATYELGRLLGRGGMGAVYLARERALDRMVAVKVLPPEIAGSEESRERFRREARTAARLTHQNIVPLHTFGETAGLVFYVMGYVRGESLADRLRRTGTIPPDETRRILDELAAALEYAHRQGVIHRDIKPDNILLEDESGRPMLADFGIAKAAATGATLTIEGAILGTPQYMSPEQASGERTLDGRSDLYSLGVLAYAMLSGRPPFEGSGVSDVIAQHLTRQPPPLAGSVPDDLAIVLRRCLEKDPSLRFQSAADLRANLSSHGDDVELTEELHASQGTGFIPLAGSAALGLASWYFHLFPPPNEVSGRGIPLWYFFAGLAAVSPFTLPWLHRTVRKQGLARESAWRHLFHLPDALSGSGPWPLVIRRKGDVWPRLPRFIRIARTVLTSAYLVLGLGFPAQLMYRNSVHWDPEPRWIASERRFEGGWSGTRRGLQEIGISVIYISAFLVSIIGSGIYGRRRGLSFNDGVKLTVTQTRGSVFWKKPEIAAVLTPSVSGSAQPARALEPRSPADYVAAIRDLAARLPATQQMLGAEATAAARQTIDAITALDEQIATLERDGNEAELSRLEQRVAALSGNASADEAAMRTLLTSQIELLRRMRKRLEEFRARRERFVESLRTLWLQVADLRAATMRENAGATEITGRVRELCEEMQRQTSAGDSIARLLQPTTPALR